MKDFFPFDKGSLMACFGGEAVIANNVQPSPEFSDFQKCRLEPDGKISGEGVYKSWSIEGGALFLHDVRGTAICEFNGAEIRNGTAYATGERLLSASMKGFSRCIMYPFVPVTNMKLKIAVSSHADYHQETVPRLLRSLKRNGFESDDILVVVGGSAPWVDTVDGVKTVHVEENKMGWTAAQTACHTDGADYWLFLHDTCEATNDFGELLGQVDVGVMYDVIRFSRDKRHDIGIFSSDFLLRNQDALDGRPDKIGPNLFGAAKMISLAEEKRSTLKVKDVYGLGMERDVVLYAGIGIKKYAGREATGGRP